MRKYRLANLDFDTRSHILSQVVNPAWEPEVRALWEQNQFRMRQWVVAEFGTDDSEKKIANMIELGSSPFSVVSHHNAFLRQARSAFVMGSHYPALVAAGALGERILNHLILALREDFASTPNYKTVYKKKSFDQWEQPIQALEAWRVFEPGVAELFNKLKLVRNSAIHFNRDTEYYTRDHALKAMRLIQDIVGLQFGIDRASWMYMHNGALFVKKSHESLPFVREFVVPRCEHVGPDHIVERDAVTGRIYAVEQTPPSPDIASEEDYFRAFDDAARKQVAASSGGRVSISVTGSSA